jgi:hypothetical protein
MSNATTHIRLQFGLMITLVCLIIAAILLLDPAAPSFAQAVGSWTYTRSLNEGRSVPSAVRLADGRALISGGYRYDRDSNASIKHPLPRAFVSGVSRKAENVR